MFRSLFLFILALVVCFGAEESSLTGRVVDASTGEPLKNALVKFVSYGRPPQRRQILTDLTGSFEFRTSISVGALTADKPGFQPTSEHIVEEHSKRDNIIIKLSRFGSIRGRVTTTDHDPAVYANVQLWRVNVHNGRREFSRVDHTPTDDRGEYLLADVAPGQYVLHSPGKFGGTAQFVGQLPPGDEEESFAPVYYGGGTSLPTAVSVQVESGKELRADFSVSMEPAYRLSGVVSGMTPYRTVTLLLMTPDLTAVHTRQAVNSGTGEFRVFDVVPGSYILRATQKDGQQFMIAETPVVVDRGPVRNIQLELSAGVDIPIEVQSSFSGERFWIVEMKLIPASPISGGYRASATPEKTGKFEAVAPGRYQVELGYQMVCVESMSSGSQNLLLEPEILVTPGSSPAPITLTLSESCGKLEAKLPSGASNSQEKVLVLFPASGGAPLAVFPGGLERTVENIRPGEYTVFLCPKDFPYAEPDARERSGIRGQRVKIEPTRTTTIQLEPE